MDINLSFIIIAGLIIGFFYLIHLIFIMFNLPQNKLNVGKLKNKIQLLKYIALLVPLTKKQIEVINYIIEYAEKSIDFVENSNKENKIDELKKKQLALEFVEDSMKQIGINLTNKQKEFAIKVIDLLLVILNK